MRKHSFCFLKTYMGFKITYWVFEKPMKTYADNV